jgi:hypothetical protein
MFGHPLMRRDDVVHAIRKDGEVLQFGPKHLRREDHVRVIEDAPKIVHHEFACYSVTKAARQNSFALVLEIFAFFEVAVLEHVLRVAFPIFHARPDLRDEHADVVIHAGFRSDVTGGGDESMVAGEQIRNERGVEIVNGRQRVEGPFGQGTFRPSARGGRRFAGHRRNIFHEQFRQFHEVDRIVHGERTDLWARFWWIVPASWNGRSHRSEHRLIQWNTPLQPGGDFSQVLVPRAQQIRPQLQVARVLRGLAIHHSRMRRANQVFRAVVLRGGLD